MIEGDTPLYCTTVSIDPLINGCFLQRPPCEDLAVRSKISPCEEYPAGACYAYERVVDGSHVITCSVNLGWC
jgi:hypothetical protein